MSESRSSVVHVRMKSERTFTDVQAAFERRLGRFDPNVYQALAEGGDPAVTARTPWFQTRSSWWTRKDSIRNTRESWPVADSRPTRPWPTPTPPAS